MSERHATQDPGVDAQRDRVGEDLTCTVCGTSLVPMLQVVGREEAVETHKEEHRLSAMNVAEASAEEEQPEPTASTSTREKSSKPTRRVRLKPTITRSTAVRRAVRQEMIACIPGFTRARAQAVLDASEDGTFAGLVSLSSEELCRVLVAAEPALKRDSELRADLVKALKRVIQ